MDKYEYKLRLEQIKKHYDEKNYKEAAKVANSIDWRKVREWSTLAMVIDIYDETKQLEDARNVCILAYNRRLGGRRLVYKLAELLIRLNELEEAQEVYDEFVRMAPNDVNRYALLYKINVAKGASTEKLISILNEYKRVDRDENCLYELACLYEKAGMIEKSMAECDEIILWFNGGDYFESALRLKKRYGALTHNQKMMLERLDSLRENPNLVKKQTVTIELPKGVLQAADIIKAATGQINTQAVNSEVDKAGEKTKESAVHEVTSEEAKPEAKKSKPTYVKRQLIKPTLIKSGVSKIAAMMPGAEDKEKKQELPNEETIKEEVLSVVEAPKEETVSMPIMEETAAVTEEVTETPIPLIEEEAAESLIEEIKEEETPIEQSYEEERYIGQMPLKPGEEYNVTSNTVKIPIPDYANYDTINIQKEIAESIRPYIDEIEEEKAMQEEEQETPLKVGDIVSNEDGVFRIVPDTKRIILPGANYKLVEVTEEELAAKKNDLQEENVEKITEEITESEVVEVALDEVAVAHEQEPVEEVQESVVEQKEEITEESATQQKEEVQPVKEETEEEILAKLMKVIEAEEAEMQELVSVAELAEEAENEPVDDENELEVEHVITQTDISVKELAAAIEKTYGEKDDEKKSETISEEVVADEPYEEPEELSFTRDITAAIEKSLSRVEENKEQASPIFEATIEELDDSEVEYDAEFDKLFDACFAKYSNLKGMKRQIYVAIENMKATKKEPGSKKGNLLITGNQSLNKLDLAIAFVKALNVVFPDNKRKIAKTTAENLNARGIKQAMEKLNGAALVVEDASLLSTERIEDLMEIMSSDSANVLVILIDTESRMIKFLGNNAKFSGYFDNLIEIRKYNVNELVEIAKEYAESKNCIINDKALLKLYLVIDKLNTGEDSADIMMAEQVIDAAIERARERMSRGLFGFIKKNQNKDVTRVLKEADISADLFNEDDQEEEENE